MEGTKKESKEARTKKKKFCLEPPEFVKAKKKTSTIGALDIRINNNIKQQHPTTTPKKISAKKQATTNNKQQTIAP